MLKQHQPGTRRRLMLVTAILPILSLLAGAAVAAIRYGVI